MWEKVQEISSVFFEKMWVHIEKISVTQEKTNKFFMKILSDDSALIIWNRWTTLHDIQKILWIILSHHFDTKIVIQVEVNNYLNEKDSQLFQFIEDKIELYLTEKKEIKLPFYSSYERKKIHNYVASKNRDDIATKSEGEGKERRLYICKTPKKMTIDMDWTDI
jgi:spoIIIJ-associated protein